MPMNNPKFANAKSTLNSHAKKYLNMFFFLFRSATTMVSAITDGLNDRAMHTRSQKKKEESELMSLLLHSIHYYILCLSACGEAARSWKGFQLSFWWGINCD